MTARARSARARLPLETLPSAGLAIRPTAARGAGRALGAGCGALRALPVPVIGRIENRTRSIFDLRCLEDEARFIANLAARCRARDNVVIIGTAGHIDHGKTALVARADGRRHRSAQGGESARHLDRSRLRLPARAGRLGARLRRRARPREIHPQHAGRRDRDRFRAARGRRRRRRDAADPGASRNRRPARHPPRRRRADQGRSRRCDRGAPMSHPRSPTRYRRPGLPTRKSFRYRP